MRYISTKAYCWSNACTKWKTTVHVQLSNAINYVIDVQARLWYYLEKLSVLYLWNYLLKHQDTLLKKPEKIVKDWLMHWNACNKSTYDWKHASAMQNRAISWWWKVQFWWDSLWKWLDWCRTYPSSSWQLKISDREKDDVLRMFQPKWKRLQCGRDSQGCFLAQHGSV